MISHADRQRIVAIAIAAYDRWSAGLNYSNTRFGGAKALGATALAAWLEAARVTERTW